MPRRPDDDWEKTRHNIHLFSGDYKELAVLHPELPPAQVIRHIVHKYITDVQVKRNTKLEIKVNERKETTDGDEDKGVSSTTDGGQ